jgi:hypothetical protein
LNTPRTPLFTNNNSVFTDDFLVNSLQESQKLGFLQFIKSTGTSTGTEFYVKFKITDSNNTGRTGTGANLYQFKLCTGTYRYRQLYGAVITNAKQKKRLPVPVPYDAYFDFFHGHFFKLKKATIP